MRWLLVLLAACAPNDGHCTTDGDCGGGNVCARDGQCWADGDVRAARVMWTVDGQAASATTCGANSEIEVDFQASQTFDSGFGFAPVPCAPGLFNVDKLPVVYDSTSVSGFFAPIDGEGNASVDLLF